MQIVRTYSEDVFAVSAIEDRRETLAGVHGKLRDARRLWYWDVDEGYYAASLSELAQRGPSKPGSRKFPAAVDSIEVEQIVEVLPVTDQAAAAINAVPIWTAYDEGDWAETRLRSRVLVIQNRRW